MNQRSAVTLSNENGASRSRPSAHLQAPPTPPYGPPTAASGPFCSPRPCRPIARRAAAPAWPSDEPAVLGCAPTASTPPATTTSAHPSERSSPTWHALRTV